MKSVNIADLKNRLSQYLSEVKNGEEILVRDRNNPIAKYRKSLFIEDTPHKQLAVLE